MFSKKANKRKSKKSNITDATFKNLAMKNVKHGMKEYLVYFITLSFGVALLYSFNTIDDILKLLGGNFLFDSTLTMIRGITIGFSIIICIVFGFLVTYANNFLMRRRKREFGIYITLGMNKKEVTKLMFKETLLIGSMALVAGLTFGLFASQGLSMLAFKMIGFSLSTFKFSFSIAATIKTIILFVLILFLVNRFNKKNIKKYKLIELIRSDKKNEIPFENKRFKNTFVFFISLFTMAIAYFILYQTMASIKTSSSIIFIVVSIILITLGIYLFFISVADFVIKRIQRHKKLYYKKLNIFTVNQIAGRIKTLSSSMTIICLLLFSSMIIIPYGLSMGQALSENLYVSTPFDAALFKYNITPSLNSQAISTKLDSNYKDFKNEFENSKFFSKDIISSVSELKQYALADVTLGKLVPNDSAITNKDSLFSIISLSDYNNIRKQQGLSPISLDTMDFAINCNSAEYTDLYKKYSSTNPISIDVNHNKLDFSKDQLYNTVLYSAIEHNDQGTIIVPDYVVSDLTPTISILNIDYVESNSKYDNMFINSYYDFKDSHPDYNYNLNLKFSIDNEKISLNAISIFIAIYLGIILLITAGAVLALQQLSEINSAKEKFTLLRRLGAKEKTVKKAAIAQISILFSLPLGLAMINSFFICTILQNTIPELSSFGITKNIITTLIIIFIIYGIYFILSLLESLSILKEKK